MSEVIPRIGRSVRLAKPEPGFELTQKQLDLLSTTSRVILALGIFAGAIAVTAIAPNAFQLLDKLPWFRRGTRNLSKRESLEVKEKKIRKAFYYLKSQGYIELVPQGEGFLMKVTQKGRKFEKKIRFADLNIKRQPKWDGHWWAVAADIPTGYKNSADALRDKLKEMKFYFLQRTLWFYPFDPRDEIDFLSAYLRIDRFITVMRVAHIDPADNRTMCQYFRKEGII